MDSGPIIAQRAVEIEDGDTETSLTDRIHAAEQALLPHVAQLIAQGRVSLEGRRVRIRA
jgi:phosphoribosylglycinamide formyltransferase-1